MGFVFPPFFCLLSCDAEVEMEEIQYSDPKTGEDTAVKETAHSPSARRSQNPPNILEKLGKFTIAAVIFGTSVIIVANGDWLRGKCGKCGKSGK